jgi:hypothetical protein
MVPITSILSYPFFVVTNSEYHIRGAFFLPYVLYCTIVMVDEGSIRIVLPVGTVDICTVSYTKSYMNELDAQRRGDLHKLRRNIFIFSAAPFASVFGLGERPRV